MARLGRLPANLPGYYLGCSQQNWRWHCAQRQGFSGPLCPLDCSVSGTQKPTEAYSNYVTEGGVKGSRRVIAYQVKFSGIDDAYDGFCQGMLEAQGPFFSPI